MAVIRSKELNMEESRDYLPETTEAHEEEVDREEGDSPFSERGESKSSLNSYNSAEDIIGPYFREMKRIPLLKAEDEQRLGRRIKEAQDGLVKLVQSVETTFLPLRSLQKRIRQWKRKKKNSREPIEFIFQEIDRLRREVKELDRPGPELVAFIQAAEPLRKELNEAMGDMVAANLRLAVSFAKRYARRGLPLSDLIQEGNLGLMKAAARFDYSTGNRFSTFASWWIRQTISRALCDQGRTIRVPVHFLENRNRFYRAFFELVKELGREPSPQQISERSGLPLDKILTIIEVSREPVSLETPVSEDGDRLGDLIENEEAVSPLDAVQENEVMQLTETALASLSPRERQIISMRFGLDDEQSCTLEEVGQALSISRERVRQLEKRALRRLRHSPQRNKLKKYICG